MLKQHQVMTPLYTRLQYAVINDNIICVAFSAAEQI